MLIPAPDKSTRIRQQIYHWLNFTHNLLLPPCCPLCRQAHGVQEEGTQGLCRACHELLCCVPCPCPRCGLPQIRQGYCGFCLRNQTPARLCLAPLLYQPPLTGLIHGFKYRARLHYGKALAGYLSTHLQQYYQEQQQPRPTLILPVPLHRRRLRSRGYNQALELGRWLERQLHIPCQANRLQRTRHTASQKGLNVTQRRANLRHAFHYQGPPLHGQTVALVDDVVTTMSTANSLARVLLRAGAAEVHIWALARTVRD